MFKGNLYKCSNIYRLFMWQRAWLSPSFQAFFFVFCPSVTISLFFFLLVTTACRNITQPLCNVEPEAIVEICFSSSSNSLISYDLSSTWELKHPKVLTVSVAHTLPEKSNLLWSEWQQFSCFLTLYRTTRLSFFRMLQSDHWNLRDQRDKSTIKTEPSCSRLWLQTILWFIFLHQFCLYSYIITLLLEQFVTPASASWFIMW